MAQQNSQSSLALDPASYATMAAERGNLSLVQQILGEDLAAVTDIGTGGGTLAGMAAGAPFGPAGILIGGVAGAVGGTYFFDQIRQLFTGEQDFMESLDKSVNAGMWEMAGPILGNAGRVGKGALEKIRANIPINAEELTAVKQLQEALKRAGITLTPAQLTGSSFYQTLENYGAAGFFGQGRFEKLYEKQREFLDTTFRQLIDSTGRANRKLNGEMFQQTINQGLNDLRAWAAPRYAQVDELAGGLKIDLSEIVDEAADTVRQGYRSAAKDKNGKPTGVSTHGKAEEIYQFMASREKSNTFAGIFDSVKLLNRKLRAAQNPGAGKAVDEDYVRAITESLDTLHTAMDEAAESTGNKALMELYQTTSKVYKDGSNNFLQEGIAAAARVDPEFAGKQLFKQGAETMAQRAFSAIDEAVKVRKLRLQAIKELPEEQQKGALEFMGRDIFGENFKAGTKSADELLEEFNNIDPEIIKNNLRAGYLQEMFSPVLRAGSRDGDTAKAALDALSKIKDNPADKATFEAIFTKRQQADIYRSLKWAEKMEKGAAGNFSLMVRGGQTRGAQNIFGGLASLGAFTYNEALGIAVGIGTLFSPPLIARFATRGEWTDDLIKQLENLHSKYNKGTFNHGDAAALFSILGNNSSPTDQLPADLGDVQTPADSYYKKQAAEMRLRQAGMQLPD